MVPSEGTVTDLFQCEVRFQEDESRQSPGRLVGTLIRYGVKSSDRAEMFMPESLYWPKEGILIDEQHNRAAPILRATPFLEGQELKVDAPVPDTQRGRDAITNVRAGVLTGLSVTFHSEKETRSKGIREIRRAFLPRAGLVDVGSYKEATVEIRRKVFDLNREDLLRWL